MEELLRQVISYALEQVSLGIPVSIALESAWVKFAVPNAMYDAARKMAERAILTELGMSAIRNAGNVAIAYDKLSASQPIKEQIQKASARARMDIGREMTKIIKSGESANSAALRLISYPADANYKDVRKSIKQLSASVDSKTMRKIEKDVSKLKTPQLKAAYNDVIESARKGIPGKVEKQLEYASMKKARYNMQRVVRTERERAIAFANVEKIAQDEDVKLVRFRLSSGHKHDICDKYATADMGYGPGVYPLEAAPQLPIHPNGQSRLEPIYVMPKKKSQTKSASEALASKGIEDPKLTQIVRKL